MAEEALTYDAGNASSAIPSHATATGRKAAVGVCAFLDGTGVAIPIELAAALPVQPGTGTTWTVTGAGGVFPVTAADGAIASLGANADAAATSDSGAFSLIALFKRLLSRITGIFATQLPAALTGSGNLKVSLEESAAAQAVTGTFWQATQPVSIATTVAVSGPLTDAQLRASAVPVSLTSTTITGTVAATQSGTWTVTGTGGTFPVTDSGGSLTVDAPVGTPVFVRLSDGSAAITTLPVSLASVPSHAVTNAGTFAVQVTSMPTTTVSGTVAATQSGTWTVDLGAVDNAVLDAIAASVAGTLTVGTHAVTQSGTWNVATVTTLTSIGGVTVTTATGAVNGAGTSAPAISIIGVDGGAFFPWAVTADGAGLVVVDGGTLTANAGTNLNTSALALESGGNLATAATLLGTIDADTSTLAGAVSGNEVQVDIVGALPAGSNSIGTVDTELPAAVTLGGNANPTTPLIGACLMAKEGATWETVVSENGYIGVQAVILDPGANFYLIHDGGNSITVDNAGTFAVQVSSALPAGSNTIGSIATVGGVTIAATDGAVTGAGTSAPGITAMAYDGANQRLVPLLVNDDGYLQIIGSVVATSVQSGTWTVQPGNTANTTPWLVTVSTALPAGTNAIGKLAANSGVIIGAVEIAAAQTVSTSTDVIRFAGTTVATDNGASSAGTLRVTLANNSTGVLGTVSTVTNLSQMGGQAIAMGTGTRSAGTQRVTIATNDVVPASQSGTWNIATLTSLSQFAGQAINLGSGNAGTGTLRVILATDQPALTNAQPANITQLGGSTIAGGSGDVSSGTLRTREAGAPSLTCGQVSCDTTAGGVQICAARAGRRAVIVTQHGTTAVYLGPSGVATTTGLLLTGTAGVVQVIPGSAAVYGITASGSQTVSYAEVY